MSLETRKIRTVVEEVHTDGGKGDGEPVRKAAGAVVVSGAPDRSVKLAKVARTVQGTQGPMVAAGGHARAPLAAARKRGTMRTQRAGRPPGPMARRAMGRSRLW